MQYNAIHYCFCERHETIIQVIKKNLCNLCNSVNTISAVYLWILISFEENSTASTKISIFNFLKELWRSNSAMLRNIFIALLFFFSSMQYYHELGKVHVSLFTRYEPPFRYNWITCTYGKVHGSNHFLTTEICLRDYNNGHLFRN